MKTTVLVAALVAAFAMPAFAEDAPRTDDAAGMTYIDPATTSSTTTQTEMDKTAVKKGYSGCMSRKTALMM